MKKIIQDSLCCEPIIRKLSNGTIVLVCGFGGGKEPDPNNYVGSAISYDEGKTWTKIKRISSNLDIACCISDFYVYKDELRVVCHYHNGTFHNWKVRIIYSKDGINWQERNPYAEFDTYCCYRGTIESNGRLIIPYQKYADSYPFDDNTPIFKAKGIVKQGVVVSEDGVHFKTYPIVDYSLDNGWLWIEATIGKYNDELIMLTRMDRAGYLYKSISKDNGLTWSEPKKSNIPNPGNKAKLINIDNKRLILLNTPNNGITLDDRNPMSIWISDDGLESFYYKEVISNEKGRYAYPDGFYENGILKFTFDLNRNSIIYVEREIK